MKKEIILPMNRGLLAYDLAAPITSGTQDGGEVTHFAITQPEVLRSQNARLNESEGFAVANCDRKRIGSGIFPVFSRMDSLSALVLNQLNEVR